MAATESWLASSTAKLFLRLAIATISLMRWLYNYGLITNKATDRFFRWAKLLELVLVGQIALEGVVHLLDDLADGHPGGADPLALEPGNGFGTIYPLYIIILVAGGFEGRITIPAEAQWPCAILLASFSDALRALETASKKARAKKTA